MHEIQLSAAILIYALSNFALSCNALEIFLLIRSTTVGLGELKYIREYSERFLRARK
jgi:hypothetical protein